MTNRYFRVIIACGHVGTGRSIEITRYFEADNVVKCYMDAYYIPRSKKSNDCVKLVKEIDFQEYSIGKEDESMNYYLSIHKSKAKRAS